MATPILPSPNNSGGVCKSGDKGAFYAQLACTPPRRRGMLLAAGTIIGVRTGWLSLKRGLPLRSRPADQDLPAIYNVGRVPPQCNHFLTAISVSSSGKLMPETMSAMKACP